MQNYFQVVEEETRDNNPIAGGFQQVDGDLSETEQEMVDFAFSQLAGKLYIISSEANH